MEGIFPNGQDGSIDLVNSVSNLFLNWQSLRGATWGSLFRVPKNVRMLPQMWWSGERGIWCASLFHLFYRKNSTSLSLFDLWLKNKIKKKDTWMCRRYFAIRIYIWFQNMEKPLSCSPWHCSSDVSRMCFQRAHWSSWIWEDQDFS